MTQTSLLDELFVDHFCGGGGASMGIELATGRVVDLACNHDRKAIAQHTANHPYTHHYCEDIWAVDPKEACAGRAVGLAWFSPDCKHFSKAAGGKPRDKNIRGLAWVTLRWAGTVRPRVIILENVEEFLTWGPVRRGKPVKSKKGQTFAKWKAQLEALGYQVEYRVLAACDYGVPTIRKRLYLVARCDGKPIVWPQTTHGNPKSEAVQNGNLLPWRTAAECIDFSLPTRSIFGRDKPLAVNTMQRIARGMDKFVIQNPQPFIMQVNHSGGFRGQETSDPLQTITGKNGYAVITPTLVQCKFNNTPEAVTDPLRTITAVNAHMLAAPIMTPIGYGERGGQYTRATTVEQPLGTIVASNKFFVSTAHLVEYYGNAKDGISVEEPLHTITGKDREGLITSHLCILRNNMDGRPVTDPLPTITSGGGHVGEVRTTITRAYAGADLHNWPQVRELLNQHCGYQLAHDEILLFWIGGHWYFISDIGLRMLTPRELYMAQGFPSDYIIDFIYNGKTFPLSEQVAKCGNSVSPQMAKMLVQANLPEYCVQGLTTLADVLGQVAG